MPKQSKPSSLRDRLKSTGVREETRGKEAKAPGGGSLPAGISGGVAKLTRLDFDVMESGDYAGEQRLYAHGTCVKPKTFTDEQGNVHSTEGALVQLSAIKLCDTKDGNGGVVPFEDNWAKAENRLKLLGVPTEDIDDDTFEEDVLQYVKDNDIYFRFRTWKPDDRDGVIVILEGVAENFDPDVEEDVQVDDDEPVPAAKASPAKAATTTAKAAPAKGKATKQAEPEAEEEGAVDLVALGKKGDKGDDDAQVELTNIAEKLGIDTNEYPDWATVSQAIQEAQDGAAGGGAPTETPAKGDLFKYNGKEVEVTAVFEDKEKVNLREVKSKKIVRNISFDELEQLDE